MTDSERGHTSGPEGQHTNTVSYHEMHPDAHPSFPSDGTTIQEAPQIVFADEFNTRRGTDLTMGYLAVGERQFDDMLPEIERLIDDVTGQIERGDLELPSAMDVHQYVATVITGAIPEGEREALALAFEERRHIVNGFESQQRHQELLTNRQRIVELEAEVRHGRIVTAMVSAKLDHVVGLIDSPTVRARAEKVVASPIVSARYFREPVLNEEMTDTERLIVYGRWNEIMEIARRAIEGTAHLFKRDFRKVS